MNEYHVQITVQNLSEVDSIALPYMVSGRVKTETPEQAIATLLKDVAIVLRKSGAVSRCTKKLLDGA